MTAGVMTRLAAGAAALAAIALLACGCASTATRSTSAAGTAGVSAAAPLSAATSVAATDGTWAVIPMGGTGPNLFWQLFGLTKADGDWSLDTPPDIATNGALILAPQDGKGRDAAPLLVGVRPSLDLSFSPVTDTSDDGKAWTTLTPQSGLADVPDALAATPDGQLIAISTGGQVSELSSPQGNWSSLTTARAVAATPAGRECALTALTATAYTAAGTPLLGGTCGKPGVAGIFAYSGGTWQLSGPTLPGSLAGQRIQVLRLTRTGSTEAALLQAGSGSSAVLVAAWTSGGRWTLSRALRLDGAQPVSASFGSGDAVGVTLTGDRGAVLRGPGSSWQALPQLPVGQSVVLALPSAQVTEALVADGNILDVWRLGANAASWRRGQVVHVPIQYGSSS
jgi:hypothetical protein